ncbi:hypothetical protein KZX46_17095 [Polymorphobacter sp. PAMC 29334]|uniref:glycine zipper 2TM domain-containing protein n=1 Tax=Polymorphobacter sp. PAMC 29334 TaxID=2862331 RepID=UPI001C79004D|nr:glycine zipper 2TM domain-containing protein [Polymorphobacter sp. PAMC 29334]QYE34470.1 hypothetical protein KZX46_17095 [Polymorphobacter sp. PAMC 29334]
MRNFILAVGLAAATITTSATAQQTCQERRDNRVIGTVAGAGIGAVLGGAISGGGLGAVLGAVGGGVAGNQLTKSNDGGCERAYGYYDNSRRWHANRIEGNSATGYYDRNGAWVVGAPSGYYDNDGRYIASQNGGYRDSNGYWVPARDQAYYAADGSYIDPRAVGYSAPQPAYDPRAQGYQGDPRAQGYQGDEGPRDIRSREDRLAQRIDRFAADGTMNRDQAYRARADLDSIRRSERSMRHYNGQLSPQNEANIQARLDAMSQRLRDTKAQSQTGYRN